MRPAAPGEDEMMGQETSTNGNGNGGKRLSLLLRALRSRNYRLFFGGQGISLIGTWMQTLAQGWLVYRLTHSATMLGTVGFVGQFPTLLVAPLAGVLADRWRLHRVLLVTQTLAMLQALVFAGLTLSGHIAIWHVVVLALCLGTINAFDMPTRQAFVVEMVETPADLPNAIAMNSLLVNGARLLGPSIAGVLVGLFGEGVCFLLNGASYVAVLIALLAMRLTPKEHPPHTRDALHGLKEGFAYALRFTPVRDILLLLALVSLLGAPYAVLMPIFATSILHGGPHTLGALMAATGIGAVSAALRLAMRPSVLGLGRAIAWAAIIFGGGLIAFSMSTHLWLSLGLLVVSGFGLMQTLASCNTVLQTLVEDQKRGRVMSFYTMAFMGMVPFGSLFAGLLAARIGAPRTLLLGGMGCVMGGALFAWRLPALRVIMRPIYAQKGIIPEISTAIRAATEPVLQPEESH
jgi:MFS family permease